MHPDHLELGNSFVKIVEQVQALPVREVGGLNGVDWDEARALVYRFKTQRSRLKNKPTFWHQLFHPFTAKWVGTQVIATCSICGAIKGGVRRARKIS